MIADADISGTHIVGIARYPIKGLNGQPLQSAQLACGAGIPGDRRFAFGIDETIDDGHWHSSRSYLINAVNDNLLKFDLRAGQDMWTITSPSGERACFDPNDPESLEGFNRNLPSFLDAIPNSGRTPRLIKRSSIDGPKGHWDFPDSELLIVNLATIRELEKRWNLNIDPRRFRSNLLIDGFPAWWEFGLYGTELSVGGAKVEILRPARRCAATSVNPDTGERDDDIQKYLAQDYGHGFFGVYARVSQNGEVAVGGELQRTEMNMFQVDEAACELAPGITLWPKMAIVETIEREGNSLIFCASPSGSLPLAPTGATGRMRIHVKAGLTVAGEIVSACSDRLAVKIENDSGELTQLQNEIGAPNKFIFVSGPYGSR